MSYLFAGRHREIHAPADHFIHPGRRSRFEHARNRHLFSEAAGARSKAEFALRLASRADQLRILPAANDPIGNIRGRWILACHAMGYLAALCTMVLAAGFVGGFIGSWSMDAATRPAVLVAAVVNLNLAAIATLVLVLLGQWMAAEDRRRLVAREIRRPIGVLSGSLVFTAVICFWQPMGPMVWHVGEPVARGLLQGACLAGSVLLLGSTFLTGHADLFGLRTAWRRFRGQPYTSTTAAPGLRDWLRDSPPVGWLLLVWSTPSMSAGHLLVSLLATALVLVSVAARGSEVRRFSPLRLSSTG